MVVNSEISTPIDAIINLFQSQHSKAIGHILFTRLIRNAFPSIIVKRKVSNSKKIQVAVGLVQKFEDKPKENQDWVKELKGRGFSVLTYEGGVNAMLPFKKDTQGNLISKHIIIENEKVVIKVEKREVPQNVLDTKDLLKTPALMDTVIDVVKKSGVCEGDSTNCSILLPYSLQNKTLCRGCVSHRTKQGV